jgi:hypothetical protein
MTPDPKSREDVLRQVRDMLASASPEQIRALLNDIRTSATQTREPAETMH